METKIIKSETTYTARYFRVEKKTIERNGKVFTKEFVVRNSVVVIIPYTPSGEIYLESQYRDAFEKEIIEVVAGTLEKDGDPLETAKRELSEETGLTAKTWKQLAVWEMAANTRAKIFVFAATDLTEGKAHLDEDEVIETIKLPIDEVVHKALAGDIPVGFHIAALLLFERLRNEGKL